MRAPILNHAPTPSACAELSFHGHAGIYPAAIALPKTRDTACRVRRERQAFFHLCVRPRLTVGRRWTFLALRTCQQYNVTGRRLTKTTPLHELLVLGTNACEAWIISRVRCSVICRQGRGCGKLTPSFREPSETSADLRGPATPRFAEFGRKSLLVVPLGNSDYLSAC